MIPLSETLLPVKNKVEITRDLTSVRIHEIAVLNFLNRAFQVAEGYAVPVVFASPTDAFSTFKSLWDRPDSPFANLFQLRDSQGKPIYEPGQSNIRYPLISVERKSWKPRIEQSWGTKRFRYPGYLSAAGSLTRNDLATIAQVEMPTAWDFTFNIEHYCMHPDTHAIFIHKLMRLFRFTGGSPQTWIPISYQDYFGKDHKTVRCYISGDIQDLSDQNIGDSFKEYRCGFTLVVEGYNTATDVEIHPVVWNQITRIVSEGSEVLAEISEDLRTTGTNLVFNSLPNLP